MSQNQNRMGPSQPMQQGQGFGGGNMRPPAQFGQGQNPQNNGVNTGQPPALGDAMPAPKLGGQPMLGGNQRLQLDNQPVMGGSKMGNIDSPPFNPNGGGEFNPTEGMPPPNLNQNAASNGEGFGPINFPPRAPVGTMTPVNTPPITGATRIGGEQFNPNVTPGLSPIPSFAAMQMQGAPTPQRQNWQQNDGLSMQGGQNTGQLPQAGQYQPPQREQVNGQLPQVGQYQPPQREQINETMPDVGQYQAPQTQIGQYQPTAPQYQSPNLPQFSPSQQMMQQNAFAQNFENRPVAQSNFNSAVSAGGDNEGRQALVDSITRSANRNFSESVLPQIRSQAYLSGGYGGAGAGIAEGLAASRLNQDVTGALASPLFGSYEAQQGRNLQASLASNQLNAQNSQFNAGQSNSMLSSLLGLGNQARGQEQNFALGIGGLNNQTRGQDQQYALGGAAQNTAARSAEQNFALGLGGQGLTARGQDQSYNLGLGGQGLTARGQDQSYNLGRANVNTQNQSNANNYALGLGSQGLTARGQDQSYNLGQANVNTQNQGNANNYALGLGSQGLTARGQDQGYNVSQGNLALGQQQNQNQFNLGLGNLRLGQQNANQNYDVSMGNLGLGQYQADTSRMLGNTNAGIAQQGQNTNQFSADTQRMLGNRGQDTNQYSAETQRQLGYGNLGLGLGNLGLNQQQADNNFYTQQRGQDLSQLELGGRLIGQGQGGLMTGLQGQYNAGQQAFNAPWSQLQQLGQTAGPFMGLGATNQGSQGYSYNPTMQWLGAGASLFSDRRLKENIETIGKTKAGLPIYTYNYKGDERPQMGVMAQEAEKKFPDAVKTHPSGYKMVNYGLLG